MVDSSATSNAMPLNLMKQLDLEITWPYRNMCGIDSKLVPTHGLIKYF